MNRLVKRWLRCRVHAYVRTFRTSASLLTTRYSQRCARGISQYLEQYSRNAVTAVLEFRKITWRLTRWLIFNVNVINDRAAGGIMILLFARLSAGDIRAEIFAMADSFATIWYRMAGSLDTQLTHCCVTIRAIGSKLSRKTREQSFFVVKKRS